VNIGRQKPSYLHPMQRRASPPVATLALVAVIFFTFAFELAGDGAGLCARWGLVPAHPTIASLLASMMLHDPSSWSHVIGNGVTLLIAGIAVERVLGHARLLALFVAAGIGGAAMHMLVDPSSTIPMVGTSACIFGVLAAAGMIYPRTVGFVAAYAAWNIWQTITGSGGPVATAAHLGGLATGYIVMRFVFGRTLAEARGWRRAPRVARATAVG
jgi:membrane associated rhomboid family serine protease